MESNEIKIKPNQIIFKKKIKQKLNKMKLN